MRIAFVGVKRKYRELAPEYIDHFNQYHLELPFYYARDGRNDVTITTVDLSDNVLGGHRSVSFEDGSLDCQREDEFVSSQEQYDVVIHWRKFYRELYRPEAVNLMVCQDHSFSQEWLCGTNSMLGSGRLRGILCFPTWHKRNLQRELGMDWEDAERYLLDGVTLGVDTDVYRPAPDKDPHQMLWASDPGRGLQRAVPLAVQLFQLDRRFRLHVCYPDYVKSVQKVDHPAIVWHGNMDNGPRLWELFNTTGVLPFTSTFMEPSSRAHRQAMAAGSLVLYPPDQGSPSELIRNGDTGIVDFPDHWAAAILRNVGNGNWRELGKNAREHAVSENWTVQAQRFNELCERLLQERA